MGVNIIQVIINTTGLIVIRIYSKNNIQNSYLIQNSEIIFLCQHIFNCINW